MIFLLLLLLHSIQNLGVCLLVYGLSRRVLSSAHPSTNGRNADLRANGRNHGRLRQEIGVSMERTLREPRLFPKLGRQVGVSRGNRVERGLGEIAQGTRMARRRREAVLEASHLQQLLRHARSDNASTTRGRDKANAY